MRIKPQLLSTLIISAVFSFSALATDAKTDTLPSPEKAISDALAHYQLVVESVEAVPALNLYEVSTNNGVIYSNQDASYFIVGNLFQNSGKDLVNLTEKTQATRNLAKFKTSDVEKELIVFPAKNQKYVINVFTDTTCGYCTKLHRELEDYNNAGITVRYLAYPRAGERASNFEQMASIWCAADKNKAMRDAKLGDFKADPKVSAECKDLVRRHLQLGSDFGVSGTPAIMLEDGSMLSGYMPATRLVQVLDARKAVAK